ncbi:hypothetical protein [Fodinicurvata sediminis]|uniref:hypothetical protein n=1 Tax=Fodinicurvata sediminis TaxID=1121832 RepID=UPI0003B70A1D|nr:hypothetical protein [Fodinicurvata sediminis]
MPRLVHCASVADLPRWEAAGWRVLVAPPPGRGQQAVIERAVPSSLTPDDLIAIIQADRPDAPLPALSGGGCGAPDPDALPCPVPDPAQSSGPGGGAS